MRLRKTFEPRRWNDDREIIRYAIIRNDGRFYEFEYLRVLAEQPVGRKLIAADLWQLRNMLRNDTTPRI